MTLTKIIKIGNSQGIILPKHLLESMNLREGSSLVVDRKGKNIILSGEVVDYEKAVRELLRAVKGYLGREILLMVLYGSVASGMARQDENELSDIDIFAIIKDKEFEEVLTDISVDVELDNGVIFSIITDTLENARKDYKRGSLYLNEILKTGRVLYGKKSIIRG